MKLFKVVTLAPMSGGTEAKEVTAFYVAESMSKVIEAHKMDLADENTDVLLLAEVAGAVFVL